MTFDPGIPLRTEPPAQSQPKILANFTALNTIFAVNHVAFNAVGGGEHSQVTFNNVIADPGEADPKCSLYIKTIAGDSELFFEKYDNTAAANLVSQMTGIVPTDVGTNHGVTLPSGIILNWGTGTCVGGIDTITFAVAYTAGTVPYVVVSAFADAAINNNAVVDILTPPTNTQFLARTTQAAGQFYYIAIGV